MTLIQEFLFWGAILLVLGIIIYNIYQEWMEDYEGGWSDTDINQDWRDE